MDQNGMCNQRWRKGQAIQQQIPVTKESRIPIIIETIDVNINQEERKVAGTRLEDPPDGVAAHEQRTEKKNDEKENISKNL